MMAASNDTILPNQTISWYNQVIFHISLPTHPEEITLKLYAPICMTLLESSIDTHELYFEKVGLSHKNLMCASLVTRVRFSSGCARGCHFLLEYSLNQEDLMAS